MLKNIVSYPPLTHAFLKWPFLTDFKKYTHPPPLRNEILVLWTKNGENPENTRICSALAYSECPREIYPQYAPRAYCGRSALMTSMLDMGGSLGRHSPSRGVRGH